MSKDQEIKEMFFLQYHLGMSLRAIKTMELEERSWLIEKFIEMKKRRKNGE